jgi:hypothetical protein
MVTGRRLAIGKFKGRVCEGRRPAIGKFKGTVCEGRRPAIEIAGYTLQSPHRRTALVPFSL